MEDGVKRNTQIIMPMTDDTRQLRLQVLYPKVHHPQLKPIHLPGRINLMSGSSTFKNMDYLRLQVLTLMRQTALLETDATVRQAAT